jgi:DNA-binding XRE family transcriptional regulator
MATVIEEVLSGCDLLKWIRQELGLSQKAFAELLGCSPRTIQSCEQGWRQPSPAMERLALLIFVSLKQGCELAAHKCWEFTGCPEPQRAKCLTHQYGLGHLCWFLTTTMCTRLAGGEWEDKRDICLRCGFLKGLMGEASEGPSAG